MPRQSPFVPDQGFIPSPLREEHHVDDDDYHGRGGHRPQRAHYPGAYGPPQPPAGYGGQHPHPHPHQAYPPQPQAYPYGAQQQQQQRPGHTPRGMSYQRTPGGGYAQMHPGQAPYGTTPPQGHYPMGPTPPSGAWAPGPLPPYGGTPPYGMPYPPAPHGTPWGGYPQQMGMGMGMGSYAPPGWGGTPGGMPGGLYPDEYGAPPPPSVEVRSKEPSLNDKFKWHVGKDYGVVLTPFQLALYKVKLEINPLLGTPPTRAAGDEAYLSCSFLFPTNAIRLSTDPPRQSWQNRRQPATFPRVSELRVVGRDFPWVFDVPAQRPAHGVTCGDVLQALVDGFHAYLLKSEVAALCPTTGHRRRLFEAYEWNRSTARGAPGGALGDPMLKCDMLLDRTAFDGVRVDDAFVIAKLGIKGPGWKFKPAEKKDDKDKEKKEEKKEEKKDDKKKEEEVVCWPGTVVLSLNEPYVPGRDTETELTVPESESVVDHEEMRELHGDAMRETPPM